MQVFGQVFGGGCYLGKTSLTIRSAGERAQLYMVPRDLSLSMPLRRSYGFHWVPPPLFSAWRRCSATPSAWLPRWSTNEVTGAPRPRPRPRPWEESRGVQPGSRGEGGSSPAGRRAGPDGSRGRGSSRGRGGFGGRCATGCCRRGDTDCCRRGEARAASRVRWARARSASANGPPLPLPVGPPLCVDLTGPTRSSSYRIGTQPCARRYVLYPLARSLGST